MKKYKYKPTWNQRKQLYDSQMEFGMSGYKKVRNPSIWRRIKCFFKKENPHVKIYDPMKDE